MRMRPPTREGRLRTGGRAFSVSVVLPVYNEEALIEATLVGVAAVLRPLVRDFEIVATNDGSRDRTADILCRLRATDPGMHLRVVTHPTNQGYGAALASGFDAASADLILMLDADGQFDVAEVVRFLAAINAGADLAIGYRLKRADPPLRLLNAWGWKLLVNGLFGYTARDVDCAFKLFRREVWQSVDVEARGATFSAELLVKARHQGFCITELPVSHFPRAAGAPTGARPRVIARAFAELFRLRVHLRHDLARAAQAHTPRAATDQPSPAPAA